MNGLILTVNGSQYGGWQGVRVMRGIEQICGSFNLSMSEKWPGQPEARKIRHGQRCTVKLHGASVISGFIDQVTSSYDSGSHTVTVSGRDATGDLVDCSAVHSGQWIKRSMEQIAADLLLPFGINLSSKTETGGLFDNFAINPGESVFEALDRMARMRGVLLVTDGAGGLIITRAGSGKVRTALVKGKNILSASATMSIRDRYSSYVVNGQCSGSNWSTPEQNSQPTGQATDKEVTRHRPLIIMAEDQAHSDKLTERAQWEANVRQGRGRRVTVSVQGWSHAGGLWQPNTLVMVKDDYLGINRELLIVTVASSLDDQGSITELTLCDGAAFDLLPIPEPSEEGLAWS